MQQAANSITYVISDINGMGEHLDAMHSAIEEHAGMIGKHPRYVFLGDLVDHGRFSYSVLHSVIETMDRFPGSTLIQGGGDISLLRFIENTITEEELSYWLWDGGRATFASFGIDFAAVDREVARERMLHRLPRLPDLLRSAKRYEIEGKFCFVHSGIRPGVPLSEQTDRDLFSGTSQFLDHGKPFEKVIVHGHIPPNDLLPEVYRNRIALNTSAHSSGRLTAMTIQDGKAAEFIFVTEQAGYLCPHSYSVNGFKARHRQVAPRNIRLTA